MLKAFDYLIRSYDSIFGESVAANSSCPSTKVQWCTNDHSGYQLCIQNPTLLPTCILALMIGVTCSKRLTQLPGKFPSRWFYSLTFFMFGMMMSSAGILHCFLGDVHSSTNISGNVAEASGKFIQLLFTIIDVGLTSNVAVSFFFCGLCDIGFLNPQSSCTRWLLFASYFTVFTLWTLGILNQWAWTFHVLYLGVIAVCCSIYLLTQLCLKSSRHALPALFVGGLYGALGLYATAYGAERVCRSEGPFWSQYIGPEFIWFLFSDVSMAFVYIYVSLANVKKPKVIKRYPIDLEKNPEKY